MILGCWKFSNHSTAQSAAEKHLTFEYCTATQQITFSLSRDYHCMEFMYDLYGKKLMSTMYGKESSDKHKTKYLYSWLWLCLQMTRHCHYQGIDKHRAMYPKSLIARNFAKNISNCAVSIVPIDSLGAVSIRKTVLPGMAIPMLKIRRPNGRLIFNMEIAIRR